MFTFPSSQNIAILQGEYSVSFVVISISIACFAAYTALSLNQRIAYSSLFHKKFWLILSSIAMGLGIWAMHFIGMSAFMLPVEMKYDWFLTFISPFPAVLASYLAFSVSNRPNNTHSSYLTAGVLMGIGISSMHYVGMAAMKMEAEYVYKPWIFLASIMIAIAASYFALLTFTTLQKYMGNLYIKIITAVIMGLAIASMHYTGMYGMVFYVEEPFANNLHEMHKMDTSLLITIVIIGISLLLLISSLTSFLDRYVDHRLHFFDALTLLPNQRQFERDLANKVMAGSLAIIHVHHLEKWIASYGYSFGDKIIKEVGDVIQSMSRPYAKIYRIEGNRFAICHFGKSDVKSMKESMERTLSILQRPLMIDHQSFVVETVCALSHSDQKRDVKELFANSLAVLHHPSTTYQHDVIEYDSAVHIYTFEREIMEDIHRAIRNNELFLHYQPKIDSENYHISGLEALLRWEHSTYGMISPAVFIPILEDNGGIFDVTDWVIEEVCKQVSFWEKEKIPFQHVSINIPGSYVTSSRLLDVIHTNLEKYKINSHYIELEITETSVINNIEKAIDAVGKFRKLGISVALDDFGTGLSSLSYLKRIPISTIKIDKSFVDDVPLSEKDSAVLKAIIALCESLNLKVVIEGVESNEQMDFILSMKEKPVIQGYHFSRPLSAKELVTWIEENTKKRM